MAAQDVIEKFGSSRALAAALSEVCGRKIHNSTVRRWRFPRERGGTEGHIPTKFHGAIWVAARMRDVELEKGDLVNVDE